MAKSDSLSVIIYKGDSRRAHAICESMVSGITRAGDRVLKVIPADKYTGIVGADVAVFYGLKDNLMKVYRDYTKARKKTILVDLGYWGRTDGGRLKGYHRIVANSLHPNYYFQMFKHSSDRFNKFKIEIKPRDKTGKHVLLAGMSEKAAWVYGLKPLQYERYLINEIRKYTDAPIIYRPKPSWKDAKPIPGTIYSPPTDSIEKALLESYLVVSHHSNVAIDAILHGKSCIVSGHGVGMSVSSPFSNIKDPYFPYEEKRHQWLYDIAYTQWSVKEIVDGKPWRHLKKEGLL